MGVRDYRVDLSRREASSNLQTRERRRGLVRDRHILVFDCLCAVGRLARGGFLAKRPHLRRVWTGVLLWFVSNYFLVGARGKKSGRTKRTEGREVGGERDGGGTKGEGDEVFG